jgi:hypothetical protein
MRLFKLTANDLISASGISAVYLNLDCVTHLSERYIEHNPNPYTWHVSLGDASESFQLTKAAFERLKQTVS